MKKALFLVEILEKWRNLWYNRYVQRGDDMKKIWMKMIMLFCILFLIGTCSLASGGSTEEEAIRKIGQTVVGYVAWAGIVIAFAMLFFIRNQICYEWR